MSIINNLKEYLSQYKKMTIKTDLIDKDTGTYALALTAANKTTSDVLGNKFYTNNYVFYAKEEISTEIDRSDMHDFLEDLKDWIEDQVENDNLPILAGKYKTKSIEVANGMLFDVNDDGTGIYQIQIKLIIMKEV